MAAKPPPRLGPWNVGKLLGQGEFSSVYDCSRDGDARVWAIKVSPFVAPALKGKEKKDQTCCRLLSWENQVYSLYAKGHPNLPERPALNAYGPNESNWRYLVIEKCDGGSLKERLGEITPHVAYTIALRVLSALQHLHSRAFVFRDLKPENVMILKHDPECRGVVLVDFGAAKKFLDVHGKHFEGAENSVGTPLYMSTNVHESRPANPRDDLESLAYLLAWMLSDGDLPWNKGRSEAEILEIKSDPKVIAKMCSGKEREPLKRFLAQIKALAANETPNYAKLAAILQEGGGRPSGPVFEIPEDRKKPSKAKPASSKMKSEKEEPTIISEGKGRKSKKASVTDATDLETEVEQEKPRKVTERRSRRAASPSPTIERKSRRAASPSPVRESKSKGSATTKKKGASAVKTTKQSEKKRRVQEPVEDESDDEEFHDVEEPPMEQTEEIKASSRPSRKSSGSNSKPIKTRLSDASNSSSESTTRKRAKASEEKPERRSTKRAKTPPTRIQPARTSKSKTLLLEAGAIALAAALIYSSVQSSS